MLTVGIGRVHDRRIGFGRLAIVIVEMKVVMMVNDRLATLWSTVVAVLGNVAGLAVVHLNGSALMSVESRCGVILLRGAEAIVTHNRLIALLIGRRSTAVLSLRLA